MVYAAAYCPLSFKSTLEGIGFDGMVPSLNCHLDGKLTRLGRFESPLSRDPTSTVEIIRPKSRAVLLLYYALSTSDFSWDFKADTSQSESTSGRRDDRTDRICVGTWDTCERGTVVVWNPR